MAAWQGNGQLSNNGGLEGIYPRSERYFEIPRRMEKGGSSLNSDSERPAKKMSGSCNDPESAGAAADWWMGGRGGPGGVGCQNMMDVVGGVGSCCEITVGEGALKEMFKFCTEKNYKELQSRAEQELHGN